MVILRIIDIGLDIEIEGPGTVGPNGNTTTRVIAREGEEGYLRDINDDIKKRHIATDWEVSSNISFTDVVLRSEGDRVNLTSIIFNEILDPNKTWFARARVLLDTGYTIWGNLDVIIPSEEDKVSSNNEDDMPSVVGVPQLSTDSPQTNHTPTMFSIEAKGFVVLGTASHIATSWVIEDIDGNVIWTSLNDMVNRTKIYVSDVVLKTGKLYRVKAMFHTSSGDGSSIASIPIIVTDNDSIVLLTYIDVVDPSKDLALEIAKMENATEIIWEIISTKDNFSQSIWIKSTTGDDKEKVTVPANLLNQGSSFILRIKAVGSVNETYKYIPFATDFISDDYVPYFEGELELHVEPSNLFIKTYEEISTPRILGNLPILAKEWTTQSDIVKILPFDYGIRGLKDGKATLKLTAQAALGNGIKVVEKEVNVLVETLPPTLNVTSIGLIVNEPTGAVGWNFTYNSEPLIAVSGITNLEIHGMTVKDEKITPALNNGTCVFNWNFNEEDKSINLYVSIEHPNVGFKHGKGGLRYRANIDVEIGDGRITTIPVLIAINPYAKEPVQGEDLTNYFIPKFSAVDNGRKALWDLNDKEAWIDPKFNEYSNLISFVPTRDEGTQDQLGNTTYAELKPITYTGRDNAKMVINKATRKAGVLVNGTTNRIEAYFTEIELVHKYGEKYSGVAEGIVTIVDVVGSDTAGNIVPDYNLIHLESYRP